MVAAHGRWGFWKCYHRLRLDGRRWNHKRVHRVYRALRLNLLRRTKRRVPQRLRQPLKAPAVLNQTWALDYMTDAFYDGQRFRALTLLDQGNREALAIEIATSIPSPRVVRLLDELVALHGRPCALRVDYGPGSSRPNRWSTGVPRRASRCTTSSRQARSERLHRAVQP